MKKICVILFLVVPFYAFSQNYKYAFSVGLGGSGIGTLSRLVNNQYIDVKVSPELDIHFRVFATNRVAIGLAGGYQSFIYSGSVDSLAASLDVKKWNLGLSAYYYYVNKNNFVMYTGARAGFSYWHFKASANIEDYINSYLSQSMSSLLISYVDKYIKPETNFSYSFLSLQATLVGVGIYPAKNLGVYGELAIGSPYWFNFGLSYRFNSQKVKHTLGY